MAKQLPIRRVGTSVPPVFEWYQKIVAPNDVSRTVLNRGYAAVAMEKALCDLIAEAERLAAENEALKNAALPQTEPALITFQPKPLEPSPPAQHAPVAKKKGR